ncbi:MAG TPA: AAA family ATPase, partial [Acidimicrobiia bacterium]|nr:AAA family ATPase [Acidimicrobiia bacterium]
EMSGIATSSAQGTFTILFTDLEGSTDLRVRVGDVSANEIIRLHDDLVRSRLEIAGAVDTKSLGDGFMALFPAANQAIETAVSIQRAIEEHNQANPGMTLSVRMGLNSGDVTQSAGDAHGTAVHAAARVAGAAQGGQILVSQVVQDLAGSLGDTRTVDRGLFWLKGFPDRWRLFEVLWRDSDEGQRVTRETRAASAAAFDTKTARAQRPVVGRAAELEAISQQLTAAPAAGLRAVVLEGEAGIGKTRLLDAAGELATETGSPFWVLSVTADEELRGPFLLFRSLLASPAMTAVAREAMAMEPLDQAQESISGRSSQLEGLSPQEQMLRKFDEVASVLLALIRERPLLLMLDDLQWADDDSIQLIRYVVRTMGSAPMVLLISVRPYSDSATGGVSKLIADLDRLRVTQVLRLQRLNRLQSQELLENLLGGPIDSSSLDSLHARSEGVPFFIEELARAYREAEALQLIDGTWTMTKLSGPAIPSSIQTLVERRLAQLQPECRSHLADAAILGRRFRLSDMSQVMSRVDGKTEADWEVAEYLQNAIDLGLLTEERPGSGYDFSFTHDQIRASLLASIPRQRRRAIHGALAEILSEQGGSENLSMLAHHALAAGDQDLAVSAAMRAAQAALQMSAPEEAVRLIDSTLTAASDAERRIEMLRIKDDALAVLERGVERMANLTEMTALTAAVASPGLEAEVKLRRASAARAEEDFDLAAELAGSVRSVAHAAGDKQLELAACLELGQALSRSPIGEAYLAQIEVDVDEAEEPFNRALDLAREIGARAAEADALRELAVLESGRVKRAALDLQEAGTPDMMILMQAPVLFAGVKALAEQALHIYEELGDQQGSTSALITLAYAHIADPSAHGMAGRIEHIRSLHHSRKGDITDSQSAVDDAQMLFAIHTYARLNLQPGLALERGREAFEAARALGDRWLEALSAGGMAMTCLQVGAADDCAAWLDRAVSAAMVVASSSMARRLEMWRGAHAASRDDTEAMTRHYRRAADLAGQTHIGQRGEALANLAFEYARIAVFGGDTSLLERATETANEVLDLARHTKGKSPYPALAHVALALVAEAQGDKDTAAEEARNARDFHGETHLLYFIPVLWVGARTLIRGGQAEAPDLTQEILGLLSYLSSSIADPALRDKWLAQPIQHELAEIVGLDPAQLGGPSGDGIEFTDEDLELLRAVTSGTAGPKTGEGINPVEDLLTKLGVATENEAIEYAIRAGVTWQ